MFRAGEGYQQRRTQVRTYAYGALLHSFESSDISVAIEFLNITASNAQPLKGTAQNSAMHFKSGIYAIAPNAPPKKKE
jgi:hypothetical protein